ncbi:MAG: DUF5011 domain-containing protein [Candidatus Izemoplasmatales bacterium]|nr:DUF5011 domain-containing protein [Candidatus Izemoplasmatales bacterium]
MKPKLLILFVFLLLAGCTPISSKVAISLRPGVDTVEINSTFVDAGAKATVNSRTVTYEVIYNDVDITKIGIYTIIYEVVYESISKQVSRSVFVMDETPPVVTLLPGIDTVLKNSVWVDAYVEVYDNSSGQIDIRIEGEVNTAISGEYMITYYAKDQSGNESSVTRIVHVLPNP